MSIEEIHKIVDKHSLWYESIGRQIIDENGIDNLKDDLVKLFSTPDVRKNKVAVCSKGLVWNNCSKWTKTGKCDSSCEFYKN